MCNLNLEAVKSQLKTKIIACKHTKSVYKEEVHQEYHETLQKETFLENDYFLTSIIISTRY